MNIPCDCERCGGDDVYATCENALMMAGVHGQRCALEYKLSWVCIGLMVLLLLLAAAA